MNIGYSIFLLVIGVALQFRGFVTLLLKISNTIRGSATQITDTSINLNRGIGVFVLILGAALLLLEIF